MEKNLRVKSTKIAKLSAIAADVCGRNSVERARASNLSNQQSRRRHNC